MNRERVCLCGADMPLLLRGHRLRCPVCRSFFDAGQTAGAPRYDDTYARDRNHFDPVLGRLKRRSLDRWLARTGLAEQLGKWQVCEVGFGGGACLTDLFHRAAAVYGIEANTANLDHAQRMGVPADHLFAAQSLPVRLPTLIDLWLFQDSFEHIPDPAAFARWLASNSATDSRVLLVAPLAGSLSERLAGRWWPHRVPDHHFHWPAAGLQAFWRHHGFVAERRFFPWKEVSAEMLIRHLGVLTGRSLPVPAAAARLCFPFNLGEIGLLLRRRAEAVQ